MHTVERPMERRSAVQTLCAGFLSWVGLSAPATPSHAVASSSVQLFQTPPNAERVTGIPFPAVVYTPGPKVPLFVLPLPPLEAGDIIWASGECMLNWKPFGAEHQNRGVFMASQVRLVHTLPANTDTGLYGLPLTAGLGVNGNSDVPYVHIQRTGSRIMAATDGAYLTRPLLLFYVWMSSEAADRDDLIPVVRGYGKLQALVASSGSAINAKEGTA